MGDFSVAAVFSDSCVLQRDKCVKVFGSASDGKKVTAQYFGKTYETIAKNGVWVITLDPHAAAEGVTLIISCDGEEKKFTDIAIGEVWVAGGQSNMEFELQNATAGEEMLKNDVTPNVRYYYTQKRILMDDEFYEAEKNTGWSKFGPESARAWSAVGYVFAKKLADSLGVTVGVIGCNWGGTSATCWMSREAIAENDITKPYLTDFDEAVKGKTDEEQIKEYQDYEEYDREWNEKAQAVYAEKPNASWDEVQKVVGPNLWPGPMSIINPFKCPGGLYKSMLKRIIPYTIKGVIFYQGESDDHKPFAYETLFPRMIKQWRDDWEDDSLAFMFTQLTMCRYEADPDYKHWCPIREAQQKTFDTVKNTGMAVIVDAGAFNDIHPKDKRPVGDRLYRQAMNVVYGKMTDDEANGPLYSHTVFTDKACVFFKHAQDGFDVKGDEILGFEIAGDDKVFYPAKAQVFPKHECVMVSSDKVAKPAYVRYLWTNYGEVTLFGKNGIPAAPFRSSRHDQDEAVKADNTIQQVMAL